MVRRDECEFGVSVDERARFRCGVAVHPYLSGHDQRLAAGTRVNEPALQEQGVESDTREGR